MSMNLGSAHGLIQIDYNDSGVKSAINDLNTLAGIDTARAMQDVGRTGVNLGRAIAEPFIGAFGAAADFEFQVDAVNAALGGLDASGLEAIEQQALDLGASTKFSANEIAATQEVLAKSGLSAEQLLGGATQAVVDLAAATGEGLEPSAASAAAALNLFGLDAEQTASVADVFTAGLNNSNASLSDFQRGVNNLGPVLANMNQYIDDPLAALQDTAAAVAFFNANGLKAADAGISLARGITNLSDPTSDASAKLAELGINAFDLEGNFIGLPDLMDQLNASMSGMSDQAREQALATIFGAEAADVMNQAIKSGGDPLREYMELTRQSGIAAEQAALRQDNFRSAAEQLGGAIETLSVDTMQPFLDGATGFVEGLTAIVEAITGLPQEVRMAGAAMGLLSGGLLAAGGGALLFAGHIRESVIALKAASAAMSAAGLPLGKLALGFGVLGLAIGAGILAYQGNFLGFADAVDGALGRANEAVNDFREAFGETFRVNVAKGANRVTAGIKALGEAIDAALGTDVSDELALIGDAVQALDEGFWNATNNGFNPAAAALGGLANAAAALGLDDLSSELYRAQEAAQRFGDTFRQSSEWAQEAGYGDVEAGIIGLGDAIDEILGTEISPYFQRAADAINQFGVSAQEARAAGLSELEANIIGVRDAIGSLTGVDLGAFFDGLGANFGGLAEGVREVAGAILGGDWQRASDVLMTGLQELSDWAQEGIQTAFDQIAQTVQSIDLGQVAVNVGSWVAGQWDDIAAWVERETGVDLSNGVDMGDVEVLLSWAGGKIDDLGAWIETTFGIDIPPLDLGTVEVVWEWVQGPVQSLGDWLGGIIGITQRSQSSDGQIYSDAYSPLNIGIIEVAWEWAQSELVVPLDDWLREILTVDQSFVEEAGRIGEELGTLAGEALVAAIQAAIGSVMAGQGGALMSEAGGDPAFGRTFGVDPAFSLGDAFANFDQRFTEAVKAALEPEFEQVKANLGAWVEEQKTELWNDIWEGLFNDPLLGQVGTEEEAAKAAEVTGGWLDGVVRGVGRLFDDIPNNVFGDAAEDAKAGAAPADSGGANALGTAFGEQIAGVMASPEFADGMETAITDAPLTAFQSIGGSLIDKINEGMATALQSGAVLGTQPASETRQGATAIGGGMAEQLVTTIASNLQTAIAAVDPGIFVGAGQALAAKLGESLSLALNQSGMQGAQLAGSGDIATAGGGIGSSLVTSLAQSLQTAISAVGPEAFAAAGSALMGKLSEAMGAALSGDVQGQPGQLVGADAAGGVGAGLVTSLAASLAASILAAPVESFAAVGAAIQTKLAEVMQTALGGGGAPQGGRPGGATGATGAGGIGQAIAAQIAAQIAGADFSAVATALQAALLNPIQEAITQVGTAIATGTAQWVAEFTAFATNAQTVVANAFVAITNAVTSGMTSAQTAVSTATNTMITNFTTAGAAMASAMTGAMTQVVAAIASGMALAVSAVESGVATIQSTLQSAAAGAEAAGAAVGAGFAAGISSQIGAVESAAAELANAATAALNAAAQIASPSRVTTESGTEMGAGLALGLDRSAPVVEQSAADLGGVTVQAIAAAILARLQEAIPELSSAFADAFGTAAETGTAAIEAEGEATAEAAATAGEDAGSGFGQQMAQAMLGQMELGGDGIGGQAIQAILGQLFAAAPALAAQGAQLGGSLGESVNQGFGEALNLDPAALGIPEHAREFAQRLIDATKGRMAAWLPSAESLTAERNAWADSLGRELTVEARGKVEMDGRQMGEFVVETAIGGALRASGRNPITRRQR